MTEKIEVSNRDRQRLSILEDLLSSAYKNFGKITRLLGRVDDKILERMGEQDTGYSESKYKEQMQKFKRMREISRYLRRIQVGDIEAEFSPNKEDVVLLDGQTKYVISVDEIRAWKRALYLTPEIRKISMGGYPLFELSRKDVFEIYNAVCKDREEKEEEPTGEN